MTREDISPQNVGTSQTTSKKSAEKMANSKRNTHYHHYKNQEKMSKHPNMTKRREAEVDPHHHQQDKNTL